MKSLSLRIAAIVLVAGVPPGARGADRPPSTAAVAVTPDFVDRLVAEAQGVNPGLQAAGARAEAATAAESAVRTWEDPTASFGLWAPTARGFSASEQGNLIYGLDQKLPL